MQIPLEGQINKEIATQPKDELGSEIIHKIDEQAIKKSQAGIQANDNPDHNYSVSDGDNQNNDNQNNDNQNNVAHTKNALELVEGAGFADAEINLDNAIASIQAEESNSSIEAPYTAACNLFSDSSAQIKTKEADLDPAEPYCGKISDRLASVSLQSCNDAQLRPSGCESVQGIPLMVREFPPLEGKKPLGRVLIVGGTHGDELTSVSVTFRWIEKLNKHHSGMFHWHVIPVMNPDGLLKRSATRTNGNGVDLNRNMPSDDWSQNALAYWQSRGNKDPRKFPGDNANSEPETQWLVDEIALFKPDAIISVHAPYGVVDFDALKLKTAPKSLGKLHLNLLGTYPGSLGNYAGINLNIPVITLELPHAWEMPSEHETDLIWQDIVSWLKKNVPDIRALAEAKTYHQSQGNPRSIQSDGSE